jgi:lipopolysaccharide/colanic/teichoic acid biosynthesis glycosyltransferase
MKEETMHRPDTIEARLGPSLALDELEREVPDDVGATSETNRLALIGPSADATGTPAPNTDESIEAYIERRVAEVLASADVRPRRIYEVTKRLLDVVVASTLLVITSPIIAVLSLIIRTESDGPAVFRQRRVGQHGKIIRFYKFRTMYVDAKERFPELYDYTFTEEQFRTSYYKPSVDPRNTPFGRQLRKTTLDELPNLFNVLKGDVSLVGPRPELPELIQYYTAAQLMKFSVKSGITGVAQTSGRNNLTIQQQIDADLEYVRRRSFLYDLRLIGRTLVMVVKRVGAE